MRLKYIFTTALYLDKKSLLIFFFKAVKQIKFFGDMIYSSPCKGIASQNTPCAEDNTLDSAVLFYCLHCICGASGIISAPCGKAGRDEFLIKFYWQYNYLFHKLRELVERGHFFICLFCLSGSFIAGITLLLKNFAI